jgi:hypothetical protein
VRTTKHIAKSASTPKTGLLATLGSLLGAKGTRAPSSTSAIGTGAPDLPPTHPRPYAALSTGFYRPLGTLLASVSLLAGIGVFSAPAALAAPSPCPTCAPWWHVTSGSRPTNMRPGAATNGVQEVTVTGNPGETFVLAELTADQVAKAEFWDKPEEQEPDFALFQVGAEASVVQTGLEGVYGTGTVEVTGGPLATGTGNLFGPVSATGKLTNLSPTVEEVANATEFVVGQTIEGEGIPPGTTILAVEGEKLTLSASATASAPGVALTGVASNIVTNVAPTAGTFEKGKEIVGAGIPAGTTIESVGAKTLTLSKPATKAGTGVALAVLGPYTVKFKGALAEQPVSVINTELSSVFAFAGTINVKQIVQGGPDGEIVATFENVGDANVNGATTPVRIADVLPPNLEAIGIIGTQPIGGGEIHRRLFIPCDLKTLTCEFTGSLPPFDSIEARIQVRVKEGASSAEQNQVSVSGGGAPGVSLARHLHISPEATPFGVEEYELLNESEGGAADVQAGSHPFQQTTSITLNQAPDPTPAGTPELEARPAGLAKDLSFNWPAGLIGNAAAMPRCSLGQFLTIDGGNETNGCSPQTAVGVALLTVQEPGVLASTVRVPEPLFNLDPAPGEPARFGFYVIIGNSPVVIDTAVRTGGDYGVTVSSNNITQTAGFISAQVTVWGVPGDPHHDSVRGWGCLYESVGFKGSAEFPVPPCNAAEQAHPPAFLSLPTSCAKSPSTGEPEPLLSTVEGDPWLHPGPLSHLAEFTMPALDGCNRLPFSPEIKLTPDGQAASAPTGLTVDVHVPQEGQLNGAGDANSAIKAIRVVLPEGMILNPAAADGLQACPEAESAGGVGFTGFTEFEPGNPTATFTPKLPVPFEQGLNFCPDAAKVGTVKIVSPLLPVGQALEGAVYLATPAPNGEGGNNPFNSTVAMYIVAKDPVSGTLVKLPGKVTLNQETGRIESTFENTPQLAFEDAEIHFFGGERAPLATPSLCRRPGEQVAPGKEGYETVAEFTPWSGTTPVTSTSRFFITSGPGGGPCPNGPGVQSAGALPFTPSLQAGSPNINAGGFSPLDTTISRVDGNQNINQVTLHMAPGMSGILAGIPLCPEAQANAGTCGPESLIGETIVSVGLGGDPFTVTGGKVYLTEKYGGGAFGLSIVNPADAGPFHLGKVIVRAKIEVDPTTAALTITTGEIPHIIKGFPLEIKHVNVTINRPNFTFNPTNCAPQSITGMIGAVEGASSPVSVPFQVTNCAALKFTPKVTVTTAAKTSKANGASLVFKISYPKGAMGSQSWFNEAKFDLPKQLPARLTTIQKACVAATFEHNRGACPAASVIGHAVVHTPVLPVPLEGPVYFVSYGGAAFPDAVLVLDGYGVHIELHGNTFINGKTSITSATFRNTPDVPFESIEVTIPSGKFGEFGANLPASAKGSFCGQKLVMPTLFKAQNGLEIHQNTAVGVTGCPPSVSIVKTAVKGNSLLVTVKLGETGTVKITGKGVKSTTKKGVKAGTHTITVPLTATGRAAKRHKTKLKIQATLTVAHRTGTATATLRA